MIDPDSGTVYKNTQFSASQTAPQIVFGPDNVLYYTNSNLVKYLNVQNVVIYTGGAPTAFPNITNGIPIDLARHISVPCVP